MMPSNRISSGNQVNCDDHRMGPSRPQRHHTEERENTFIRDCQQRQDWPVAGGNPPEQRCERKQRRRPKQRVCVRRFPVITAIAFSGEECCHRGP